MVNAPDCGSGTRGFDSHHPPFIGVSPSGKARDFDSRIRRFESCYPSCFTCKAFAPLAQVVEHLTFNQGVKGSSPLWRILIKDLGKVFFYCLFQGRPELIFYGISLKWIQLKSGFSFPSKRSKVRLFIAYLLNRTQLRSGFLFLDGYIYYGRSARFYGALNWAVWVELKNA